MHPHHTGTRIARAIDTAKLTQRALEAATGISQSTLSRIVSGARTAKLPEIAAIAHVTGTTVAELTGSPTVAARVQCAARATNGSDLSQMRATLLHYLELDAYLDDQAVPATV
ncbi:helix-turn-helix domain-containing protein [Amycolatopsis panacis]|uniref:XRE family transcriptional regulator n=1 Tax=Amycolatopsis panacis TaxID=2340917 RepID=A0A419I6G7_9PSEU|nr:helix-turn-helix transcriptional regulator [Amycolatopsis panacis]RJQ87006.1 XRE family transcriptional regulator [Amycolatopsis panacis]